MPGARRRAALVVDLDPQANATSGLGERANGSSTYDLLDGPARCSKATRFENLDLVPSKADLAGLKSSSPSRRRRPLLAESARRRATRTYSFVFLDCPPSLGPLTVNALAAADRVLVPVQAEYYALEGLPHLLETRSISSGRA